MPRLLIWATALALTSQAASAATLERIRETGAVRIGYRADAKPYSYRDAQGQPAGYVVDLCLEVAAALERRLLAANVRRRRGRDLPFQARQRVRGPCRQEGWRAGRDHHRGDASQLARGAELKTEIVPVKDHRAGLDLLSDDKIDAYFADRGIVAAMLREGGRPGFQISRQYFSYETYALALPRDDGAFRLLVDRTLARLFRTGKINAILARTFGKAPADELLKAMIVINSVPDR